MKKTKNLIILLISLFLIMPVSNAATYKIRNGNVVNPNGKVQENINIQTQIPEQKSNTYYNRNNDDDDIIFTKANEEMPKTSTDNYVQKPVNNVNTDSSNQKVETLKRENEPYLKEPTEDVNFYDILVKYFRDPYANEHKIAIENNQKTHKDCIISTFSNSKEYGIWCKSNPNYGYYYSSVHNPILNRFEIIKNISNSKDIKYRYIKISDKWVFSGITINIKGNEHDYVFIYNKNSKGFILAGYYIDDTCYKSNGKYDHTRTTKNF